MGLKKLTFDEALNTAKDDAFFNWYLTNKTNGIFTDLGDKCEATSSNGKITFKDGFVSIYGRRIYIENGTNISVSLDSTKKGYVILKVDTINNEASLTLKEGTSSNYPSLTQTNLLESDGVFEFPMIGYSKTTTSLTLDKSVIKYIETNQTKIDTTRNNCLTQVSEAKTELKSESTYKFNISSMISKPAVLITFACCNNIFAVSLNTLKGTTNLTFTYNYLGSNYNGYIERSGDYLYIELGSSTHTLKRIDCFY